MSVKLSMEEARDHLAIDPDQMDHCLTEQPELFLHVADQYAMAVSRRDEAKLILEEATAELDDRLRRNAVANEEKVTEAMLQQRLRLMPRVKELTRVFLDARAKADRWLALKESYSQRSFMLREVVSREVARWQQLGADKAVAGSRANLSDIRHEEEVQARRRERQAP